jgi:hypothetical protein
MDRASSFYVRAEVFAYAHPWLLALATGAIVAALPLIDAKGHHTVGSRVPIAVFILIGVTLATRLLISLTPGARRSE